MSGREKAQRPKGFLSRCTSAFTGRSRRKRGVDLADTLGLIEGDSRLLAACAAAERALSAVAPGKSVPVDADSLRLLLAAAGRPVGAGCGPMPPTPVGAEPKAALQGEPGPARGGSRSCLHLLNPQGCDFVLTRVSRDTWQCLRFPAEAPIQIRLFYGPTLDPTVKVPPEWRRRGWIVYEVTCEKTPLLVVPATSVPQDSSKPPVDCEWERYHKDGTDKVPGWRLVRVPPELPPLEAQQTFKLRIAKFEVTVVDDCANVTLTFTGESVTDESLEELLQLFKVKLEAAAQRPELILFWKMDLQESRTLTWKQTKRFLAWIDEVGLLLVLTCRGSVIRLNPVGLIGQGVLWLVNLVLKAKPPPWPNRVLPTLEEADAFIAEVKKTVQRTPVGESKVRAVQEVPDADAPPTLMAPRRTSSKGRRPAEPPAEPPAGAKQSRLRAGLDSGDERPVPQLDLDASRRDAACRPCVCSPF